MARGPALTAAAPVHEGAWRRAPRRWPARAWASGGGASQAQRARSGVRAPAARRMRQAAGAAGHAPAAVEARRRPGSCGVAAHAKKGRRVVGLLGFRPSLIILYGMMLVSGHQMKSDGREHASIKVSLEGPFQATNGLPALLSCWAVRAIRAVRAEGLLRAERGVCGPS